MKLPFRERFGPDTAVVLVLTAESSNLRQHFVLLSWVQLGLKMDSSFCRWNIWSSLVDLCVVTQAKNKHWRSLQKCPKEKKKKCPERNKPCADPYIQKLALTLSVTGFAWLQAQPWLPAREAGEVAWVGSPTLPACSWHRLCSWLLLVLWWF